VQVEANPGTLWLYKELSQEVKQLSSLGPSASGAAAGTSSAQQCQLLMLQAEAHQHLAKEPGSIDRSACVQKSVQLQKLPQLKKTSLLPQLLMS